MSERASAATPLGNDAGRAPSAAHLLLVRLLVLIGTLSMRAARALLFRRLDLDAHPPRRILISRVGNIGDLLVAIPTLAAIRARYPDAHLALLTSPGSGGLPGARDLPAGSLPVDEVIDYRAGGGVRGAARLVRRVRRERFDLFVRLGDDRTTTARELRFAVFARLVGCRRAAGLRPGPPRLLRRVHARASRPRRMADEMHAAVAGELDLPRVVLPALGVDGAASRRAVALLARLGLPDRAPYLVLHPGAKRSTNRWFPDRFARVADEVHRRTGIEVVLTGGPNDRPAVEAVSARMEATPIDLCGRTDLPELAALLAGAVLYLGNDTGPMHLAAAVGTPVVAVFSARDVPERWYPGGDGHTVFRRATGCSPCFREECDRGLDCLQPIGVDEVLDAVMRTAERRLAGAAVPSPAE